MDMLTSPPPSQCTNTGCSHQWMDNKSSTHNACNLQLPVSDGEQINTTVHQIYCNDTCNNQTIHTSIKNESVSSPSSTPVVYNDLIVASQSWWWYNDGNLIVAWSAIKMMMMWLYNNNTRMFWLLHWQEVVSGLALSKWQQWYNNDCCIRGKAAEARHAPHDIDVIVASVMTTTTMVWQQFDCCISG